VADLAERCSSFDSEFTQMISEGNYLDRFYIQSRYPNAMPGSVPYKMFSSRDGEHAVSSARKVLSFVKKKIA
jgi:HEPN domain-containing protein